MKNKMRRMLCGERNNNKQNDDINSTNFYESKLNDLIELEKFSYNTCIAFSTFFIVLLFFFIFYNVKNPLTIFLSLSFVAGTVIISWLLHTSLERRIKKIRKLIDALTSKMD